MGVQQVLIGGSWRASSGTQTFQAANPATGERFDRIFPISPWDEVDQALAAAALLARDPALSPGALAEFLERYAVQLETRTDDLVAAANAETALPAAPRLREGELPRTCGQLRQAAAAARDGSWVHATIDTTHNIRSHLEPIGPVLVIGPNNFPFAFNSIAGGDFAAAIAVGNPVIAKGHPDHPFTTSLCAEAAVAALAEAGLPPALVQLIYQIRPDDGLRLVGDARLGAAAFTGSRRSGMALKAAADRAGKPIYLEMSSLNPVVILPGALVQNGEEIAQELTASCLMGSGQFCTNPGLVILHESAEADAFVADLAARFAAAPAGTLLSANVQTGFLDGIRTLEDAGAELVRGGEAGDGPGASVSNTILQVTGHQFLRESRALQTECFGNGTLVVLAHTSEEIEQVLDSLEGNLTGCIYSDTRGGDDATYERLAPRLASRVGRLLNDKMPTGVAVSPAMVHGGPFPATGHPGFTSVGIPAAMTRFARLVCYDNIRPERLPAALANKNPGGRWRNIDLRWTREDIPD